VKRIGLIILFLAYLFSPILAEEHTDIFSVEYGYSQMLDGYLSPLVYDGQHIGLKNEWWTHFTDSNSHHQEIYNWRHVGMLNIEGARLYNQQRTNIVYSLRAQAGWGAHRIFDTSVNPAPGTSNNRLKGYVGPYLDLDFMGKEMVRNVNKPYSFDIGLDCKIMLGGEYKFMYSHKHDYGFRLHYLLTMNMLGMEWMQDYWQSYYETTEGVNLNKSISFTHPFNRQNLMQDLGFDIAFPYTAWRLGVRHEYMHYGTKEMPFYRQTISGYLGIIFSYKVRTPHPINL